MHRNDAVEEVRVEVFNLRNQIEQGRLRLELKEDAHIAKLQVGVDEQDFDALFHQPGSEVGGDSGASYATLRAVDDDHVTGAYLSILRERGCEFTRGDFKRHLLHCPLLTADRLIALVYRANGAVKLVWVNGLAEKVTRSCLHRFLQVVSIGLHRH